MCYYTEKDTRFYTERGGYYHIVNDMNIKSMANLDYEYKQKKLLTLEANLQNTWANHITLR